MVYYQLCANFFVNDLGNCHAHLAAIGAQDGEIDVPRLPVFRDPNVGALSLDAGIRLQQGMHTAEVPLDTVPIHALDSLTQLPPADLVKIDVEGLELEVLEGGRQWFERCRYPHLLFEVWGDYMPALIPKREKLLARVQDTLGYELFMMGELCIAQHPSRKCLSLTRQDTQYAFAVSPPARE